MKRIIISLLSTFLFTLTLHAQDIIVTNQGDQIKAYNIEIGSSAIFYQLSERSDADIKRIAKKDVLIIKEANGTIIFQNSEIQERPKVLHSPIPIHDPITAYAFTP